MKDVLCNLQSAPAAAGSLLRLGRLKNCSKGGEEERRKRRKKRRRRRRGEAPPALPIKKIF